MMQVPLTTLSDLPAPLTAQVLSHVPQQQRLTKCALVCRAWASAATLSTIHVECALTEAILPAFQTWLQQHAGQLLTLRVSAWSGPDPFSFLSLRLPLDKLKQLQTLQVEHLKLQLPGLEAGTAAAEVSLPCLQHLQLNFVWLQSTSSLLELTDAPQLTTLGLGCIGFIKLRFTNGLEPPHYDGAYEYTEAAVQQVAWALQAMLQRLPRLSVLELPCMPLSDAAVQQLAEMQGLRRVSLSDMDPMPACKLQLLPNSITHLWFSGPQLPQLQQLTRLLQLELVACRVLPTLLGSAVQTLKLSSCRLLASDDPHTERTAALLDVLPKLARLQELELLSTTLVATSAFPEHFAALAAPSHLTRLVVHSEPFHEAAPLPKGAAQHMFPAHRRQLQLRWLAISADSTDTNDWCIDSADLASISSCCPRLQLLDIHGTVQPGADVSVLLQLPDSCTLLAVGGAAFSDAAAATVAQLAQLKHLGWQDSGQLTDTGLEQLTALDLRHLSVHKCGLSAEVCTSPGEVDLSGWGRQVCVSCDSLLPATVLRVVHTSACLPYQQQRHCLVGAFCCSQTRQRRSRPQHMTRHALLLPYDACRVQSSCSWPPCASAAPSLHAVHGSRSACSGSCAGLHDACDSSKAAHAVFAAYRDCFAGPTARAVCVPGSCRLWTCGH
jgi:hypothetical protein